MVLTKIKGTAPSDVKLWLFKVLSGTEDEPEIKLQFT